jgi:hypothetical protein
MHINAEQACAMSTCTQGGEVQMFLDQAAFQASQVSGRAGNGCLSTGIINSIDINAFGLRSFMFWLSVIGLKKQDYFALLSLRSQSTVFT